jgi:glycosyltransferase involved in cell wall biosynthesis
VSAIAANAVGRRPAPRSVLMTTDTVGGVWRYSIDLGRALGARGIQATLAVMGPPPTPAQAREAACAALPLHHGAFPLEWMDEPWADLAAAGDWLLSLERMIQPDVVHLNGYSLATLAWRAPVVVVAHSCVRSWWTAVKGEAPPARFDRYTAAVAAGIDSAAALVAPSAAMLASIAAEYDTMAPRAQVIANGSAAQPPYPAAAARGKDACILAAGRLWDDAKNIQALCAIAGRLPWPVYVAGDSRAPDGSTRQLTGVHLLGHLAPHDLREWYERAAIYVLPARYEPFGLSVLEAANAGCALVLGDIASFRENWEGSALFVAPGDGDALMAAIQSLISDAQTRQSLGRKAQARAAGLTVDRCAEQYVRLYESLSA